MGSQVIGPEPRWVRGEGLVCSFGVFEDSNWRVPQLAGVEDEVGLVVGYLLA